MSISFTGAPVKLGVITDIQYAFKPDRCIDGIHPPTEQQLHANPDLYANRNFTIRWYSKALERAEFAVKHLNDEDLSATLHLGDIIDGNQTISETRAELSEVMSRLASLKSPLLHVIGNHCLAAGRTHLHSALSLTNGAYYTNDLSPKWRIIVIDTVDLSVQSEDQRSRKLAMDYCEEHSGEPNAVPWNGGLGPDQLLWLKSTIDDTRRAGKYALVCGHIPVFMPHQPNGPPEHVLWDNHTVGKLFAENNDVVKAYFSGHYHQGSYSYSDGIHYVTFESILDSQHEEGAWAVAELFEDAIVIKGHGEASSRQLKI